MQEDHLRNDDTTTDDGGSTRSGSQMGDPNPNVDFAVDRFEDMSSTDMSDPAVQDLVQFLNKQSGSISREIDSALTSTDESDDDSYKRNPSSERSWDAGRAAESDTLVAAARSKVADPKHEFKKLNEKVRMLLTDRKIQKETIDAQKAELVTFRAALADKSSAKNPKDESFESAVHKSELAEAERSVAAAQQTMGALRSESQDKTELIVKLEAKIEGLLKANDNQMETIESQNAKIAKLTDMSFSLSGTPAATRALQQERARKESGESNDANNTYENEFAALDAALGEIDLASTSKSTSMSATPGTDDSAVRDLNKKLAQRDQEVAQLSSTVKRLEALAFEQSRGSQSSDAETSYVRTLQQTSDEQGRTIQLQKSTIGSLKEEVELLTRQLNEHQNDNHINVDKQKKVSSSLRLEQERIAVEAERLERDKQEFIKHLKEFKELRREVLGGALVTTGGGVSKTRYRTMRHKRDKYKRKDYRKGKDVNAMQKRLLQNVDLLEVDDSQSSSESVSTSISEVRSQSQSQSSKSVQLVQDTSSEAGDSEN